MLHILRYVHRVGRTARMGHGGESVLFLMPHEQPYLDVLASRGVTMQVRRFGWGCAALFFAHKKHGSVACCTLPLRGVASERHRYLIKQASLSSLLSFLDSSCLSLESHF